MELQKANSIYKHFYNLSIKNGFDEYVSNYLASKPAKYVYDTIKTNGCLHPKGYIKYCLDLNDDEFNNLDPVELEQIWISHNNGICPTYIKRDMIRSEFKMKRDNFKKAYYTNYIKEDLLLNKQFDNINIDPIEDLFDILKLK